MLPELGNLDLASLVTVVSIPSSLSAVGRRFLWERGLLLEYLLYYFSVPGFILDRLNFRSNYVPRVGGGGVLENGTWRNLENNALSSFH
jgi:hypothetical protein